MATTGCYILAVVAEPENEEHKKIILQMVNKGLLSWDVNATGCDLKGLEQICKSVKEKLSSDDDILIQYSTESLGVEVLLNPTVSTLKQCVKNLLTSTIGYKHIIHAGYTFAGSGSWILQNGTYSFQDFQKAFRDAKSVSPRGSTVHVHCVEAGDWNSENLGKEVFSKIAKVSLNPADKADHILGAENLGDCLESVLKPHSLTEMMEASPLVGNIRFNRPTLYVFPAGEGDCALFGINGFNMLVDGGFNRKPCSWEFIRHLDRLDAILVTRISESNFSSMSTLMKRKTMNSTHPQIGYVFTNIAEGKTPSPSEESQKDQSDLLVSVVGEGHNFMQTLNDLKLVPHQCWRDASSEPFVLYHKVGHGTLEMYILSPPKDNKEMRQFLAEWGAYKERFSTVKCKGMVKPISLSHATSICAILVWRPNDPRDTITRIMFPGSAPQSKVFEGLEKLKALDILKQPTVTKASLNAIILTKPKPKAATAVAKSAVPNRKNTASPVLSVSSAASRNGDISGKKKEVIQKKVVKEVKNVVKEAKVEAKAKEVKKESKAPKELKKEVKKEPKKEVKAEKPLAAKPAIKKDTLKVTESTKTTTVKKTVKKEVLSKPSATKPEKAEVKKPKSATDTKTAKEVASKKAAKTTAKPKTKLATKAPSKTKATPVPKSPSKVTRAIAASATIAAAAIAVGVAEFIDNKVEQEDEVLKVEAKQEDAMEVPETLQNGSVEEAEVDDHIEIPASPVRQETMSPALSEPVSLTTSDTLSSAPMETVSPTPPQDIMSPTEEKEVNEIKELDMQSPTDYEERVIEPELESAPTPVVEQETIVDEGIVEDNAEEKDIEQQEATEFQGKPTDVMSSSLIGETLEEAEHTDYIKESSALEETEFVKDQYDDQFKTEFVPPPTEYNAPDAGMQFASASMEGSFCAGLSAANREEEIREIENLRNSAHYDVANSMEKSMMEQETDEDYVQIVINQYRDPVPDNILSDRVNVAAYESDNRTEKSSNLISDYQEQVSYDNNVMSYGSEEKIGEIHTEDLSQKNFPSSKNNVTEHEYQYENQESKTHTSETSDTYQAVSADGYYQHSLGIEQPAVMDLNNQLSDERVQLDMNEKALVYDENETKIYLSENKEDFDEEEEMIRHPTPPGGDQFYRDVGRSDDYDDEMRDPIGQHFINPSVFRNKGPDTDEPLYEENEDSGSERSASPIIEQPVYGSVDKADFPELVTLSGGTTPSEPQSPKSPYDNKKQIAALEVMEALSEHDGSECSVPSPLIRDHPETFGQTANEEVRKIEDLPIDDPPHESAATRDAYEKHEEIQAVADADADYTNTEKVSFHTSDEYIDQARTIESDRFVIQPEIHRSDDDKYDWQTQQELSHPEFDSTTIMDKGLTSHETSDYHVETMCQDPSIKSETTAANKFSSTYGNEGFDISEHMTVPEVPEQFGSESSNFSAETFQYKPETPEYSNRYSSASTVELDNTKYSSENIPYQLEAEGPSTFQCSESQENAEKDFRREFESETDALPKHFNDREQYYPNGYDTTDPAVTAVDAGAIPPPGINGNGHETWKSYSGDYDSDLRAMHEKSDFAKGDMMVKSGEQSSYIIDSHYQSDSPEDQSMKNDSPRDVPSPVNHENTDDAVSAPPPTGYGSINNKLIREDYPEDNLNYLSAVPPAGKTKYHTQEGQDNSFGESSEEEEDSTSIPGNVSPYAYTNKAYNQDDDADGNRIYKQPFLSEENPESGRTMAGFDMNNPLAFTENTRMPTEMNYSAETQERHQMDPGYDFRVEDWGKPMGLPTPSETTKTVKKTKPASSSSKTALNNGKATASAKATNSPVKKAKDHADSDIKPVYVDLAYVPHHGDPNYSDVEFFRKIRARYYVFSGISPSKEVLNAFLEAKKSWKENLEVTIIPTYETDTLGYWMAQNQDTLAEYSIEVAPSASRCTVNLQDHETSCAAYRLEF